MPAAPIHRFQNTPSNPFGPAPASSEAYLPRPKSASSLPYARPSNPTIMGGTTSTTNAMHAAQHQNPHPIMVALSGWPEPVYVAESKEVARRRSRAGTPVLQPLTTGMGDGVDLSMLPPLRNGNGNGNGGEGSSSARGGPTYDNQNNRRYREEHSPYPVSSTRSTRTSPVNSGPNSPTMLQHHSYPNPPLPKGYPDPRYGPNATLHDRALRVAPAWTSSSSRATPQPENMGVGVRVTAGQRGEGVLVMRAVPDVYPPPGRVMAGAGGVAKEVYPRDPNSAFLWSGSGGPATNGGPMMSPTHPANLKDE